MHMLNSHAKLSNAWLSLFIDGKEARKTGAGSFIQAASLKYQELKDDEKARLKEKSETEITKELTIAERKKSGAKIFKKIQKQVELCS